MNKNLDLERSGKVKTGTGFEELTVGELAELAENPEIEMLFLGNRKIFAGRTNGI